MNENHYNNKKIDENKKNANSEEYEYNGQLFKGLNFELIVIIFILQLMNYLNVKKIQKIKLKNF